MKSQLKASPFEAIQGRSYHIGRTLRAFTVGGTSRENERISPCLSRMLEVAVLVVLAMLYVLPATPALASGAPRFEEVLREETVHATRAHIAVEIFTGELEVKWRSEYAPAENGKAPAEESPSWVLSASGSTKPNVLGKLPFQEVIYLGTTSGGPYPHPDAVVRHLTPSAAYYVRFHIENTVGQATAIFPFSTTAVAKPEIAKNPFSNSTTFSVNSTNPTSAVAVAQVESDGAQTEYEFEYAPGEGGHAPAENSSSWALFTTGSTGTISVAEDFAAPEAKVIGLTPETTYFARLKASNEKGSVDEVEQFVTPTAKPVVSPIESRNVTGTSAHFRSDFLPHDSETNWRIEYATSENGPWITVGNAGGVVSQAEAEALPEGSGFVVEGALTGLTPATVYYVRLFAENKFGEGVNSFGEPISTATRGVASFRTFGPPSVLTFAVHGLHGESLRVMGGVNPNSAPTSEEQMVTVGGSPTGGTFTLAFEGQTTAPIAFDAPAEGTGSVEDALKDLSAVGSDVLVSGPVGGPYTVYFYGVHGGVSLPQITADGSGLTPSGMVTVARTQAGGIAYVTHYHFEYVAENQFEKSGSEGGFAKAERTPDVELTAGDSIEYVGADLPGLVGGESYRFRIVATNTSPGDPIEYGGEQVLRVPVSSPVSIEEVGRCPNELLRTGHSAHLPDCRAYEQLTPIDKGGAQEIFNYGGNFGNEGALPGLDGDHLEYGSTSVKWGAGPDAGQSPYFFSRGENGWQITAAGAQPTAGIYRYTPQVFSGDLRGFAFEAGWNTSPSNPSPRTEFEAGSPGGSYVVAASVPHGQAEPGWVAASGDFSKLILGTPDRTLLGHSTHTVEGPDLYEYAKGTLNQVNVTGQAPGVTLGSCGATVVRGSEGSSVTSSSHAVSENGSRVFFEAVPGSSCSAEKHLYMRVNSAETVDIGAFRFIAADSQGEKVLIEKDSGEDRGLYIYRTDSRTTELLPSTGQLLSSSSGAPVGASFTVSEDLSTVYIRVAESVSGESVALYRYDIPDKRLLLVSHLVLGAEHTYYSSSSEGRYFYFIARTVAGLPAGGPPLETPHGTEKGTEPTPQVFRYDSAESVVQCISCASPFDPEPRLPALFTNDARSMTASENGDYVFFDTPAALLPSDVDGELGPEGNKTSSFYSLSSDVYEWRRVGVGGCSVPQGCLALVTSGGGGFLNILLGTSVSGRDVFFSTNESLLSSDKDTAGDIYDARVDGGFAVSARPVECEGDACSTPFAAPNDPTPSSSTFHGAGNIVSAPPAKVKGKPKPKPKCKTKSKRKCKVKAKKRLKSKIKHAKGHTKSAGKLRGKGSGGAGR